MERFQSLKIVDIIEDKRCALGTRKQTILFNGSVVYNDKV